MPGTFIKAGDIAVKKQKSLPCGIYLFAREGGETNDKQREMTYTNIIFGYQLTHHFHANQGKATLLG